MYFIQSSAETQTFWNTVIVKKRVKVEKKALLILKKGLNFSWNSSPIPYFKISTKAYIFLLCLLHFIMTGKNRII